MSPARKKVFISYSHDNPEHKERVLALADRLRRGGVDARIDQYVQNPEYGWQSWTETQMREADFILAVCTETYLKRAEHREAPGTGHGAIWEISIANLLLYEEGMKNEKLVPVTFDEADSKYIPLPWRGYSRYCVADEQGYLDLYRYLTGQPFITMPELGSIEKLPQRSVPVSKTPAPAKLLNVPPRNGVFTGRESILSDLRADLVQRGRQALFGLGGVGKTQIAAEYAYRNQDDCTTVLWTFAQTEQSVRGGFAALATLLDLPEKESAEQSQVVEAVLRWLEQHPGWLLVLDNADDPPMVKPFLPQPGKGHVLLTSRAHTFQALGIFSPREINVLSPAEARKFLLHRTGKAPTAKSPEADALAEELGCLPLAMEQAAAYTTETGASFATYLAAFKRQRLKVLEKAAPVIGNEESEQQKRTVATTWALNFADVEKQSAASAELLRLSAVLAPDAIPLELLEKGGAELPEQLAAKLGEMGENPLAVDELLSPLLRFSLVRRDEEHRTYSIHPLVQDVVREGLSKGEQKAWAERAVRRVNDSFPDVEFKNWPQCDRLLPHALACSTLIQLWDMKFIEAARLLNQAGVYLKERAEYAQAEPLYRRALVIYEQLLGVEHPDTATSLSNLAELFWRQGKSEEAEPLVRRALAIDENLLGPDHLSTTVDLNSLAALLVDQGKPEEAEPLFRRALAIRERLDPEHPETATGLNNLAILLRSQGNLEEAEPLYRRALDIRKKVLGTQHPDTANSLNGLALLLEQKERPEEAESLFRQSLAIREMSLGLEHPDVANSLHNLACLLGDQGKPEEAELLFRRALCIREKMLGPEHPRTVATRNNLIYFYREQGRDAEADALEGKAP